MVDTNGTSNQGRIVSIDQGYGITIFTDTKGHKRTFHFESIRSYKVVQMEIDVQHHKNLRKWRISRSILEFKMSDKSQFKGKLISTYATVILIVE